MSITKIQKQLEAPPNHPSHVDLFYAVRGRSYFIYILMAQTTSTNNLGRREYFRTYRCLDYGCNTGTDMIGPWDRPCLC